MRTAAGIIVFAAGLFLTHASPASAKMSLIPGGSFTPLFPSTPPGSNVPETQVAVASFYLDVLPVTNSEFQRFLKAKPEWRKSRILLIFSDPSYLANWKNDLGYGDSSSGNNPVVFVSWFAARAYCKWVGKDLPTLSQWEFAARPQAYAGHDAGSDRNDRLGQMILEWYGKPTPKVYPDVGKTFKSQNGIYDLHGLIWEWTLDFNSLVESGNSRVDCGGGSVGASDAMNYAGFMRYAFRSSLKAAYSVGNLGFRCASDHGD